MRYATVLKTADGYLVGLLSEQEIVQAYLTSSLRAAERACNEWVEQGIKPVDLDAEISDNSESHYHKGD